MSDNCCCVCGQAPQNLATYESSLRLGPKTYCIDCSILGREPYEDLVEFGWYYNWFHSQYQQRVIIPTLQFYNKTIAQFNEDVRKKRDELNDSI